MSKRKVWLEVRSDDRSMVERICLSSYNLGDPLAVAILFEAIREGARRAALLNLFHVAADAQSRLLRKRRETIASAAKPNAPREGKPLFEVVKPSELTESIEEVREARRDLQALQFVGIPIEPSKPKKPKGKP